MVVEAFLGGVATHVSDLSVALVASGHDVHVLYSDLRADGHARRQLSRMGDSGVKCVPLPIAHAPALTDVRSGAGLRRYAGSFGRFDILHAHSTKAGFLLRLSAFGLGAPVVYTPHAFLTLDPQLSTLRRRFAAILERILASVTSAVVAVSEAEARHALALGLSADRVFVVPNGIARVRTSQETYTVREAVRREWNVLPDDICVGFVGRLTPQKKPERVLGAFAQFRRRCDRAKLIMAGYGPLEKPLRQRAEALGIGDQLRWLGEVRTTEVMPGLDVLLLTSEYEGFPYVLLEAMVAGVPVVTTPVGGVDMLVVDGESGFVADSREDFAGALTRLAAEPSLRLKMQTECSRRVEGFSVERMASGTLDVYHHCLALHFRRVICQPRWPRLGAEQ
ncbi:MAG TPA: glycosyltransferase family 4 protein [Bryobacteraceae bacterium]|nr:glycosyltransferase family 4 protein [Bryobacteraceae bacterium]